MSKWLKGKKELFDQFKEQKKKEQEENQAGPRRIDIVWDTPAKGTVDKPKKYVLRLLPDADSNFYKTFYYHMYKSAADETWNFVFCPKSHDMTNYCPFCAATMKLYKGSKADKKAGYNYKRKRKHCVNAFIVNDPRDADAESKEEMVSGKVKIYEFPDTVESKIASEMNDDAYGAGINIFDPGEDGVDFILSVGSTKPIQDEGPNKGKTFPDYNNSKFASKSNPIMENDEEIEEVMEKVHNLDEYLSTMERDEKEIVELIKKEMLWEYVRDDYPKEKSTGDEPKQEETVEKTEPESVGPEEAAGEDSPAPPDDKDEPKTSNDSDDISDDDLLAELDNL